MVAFAYLLQHFRKVAESYELYFVSPSASCVVSTLIGGGDTLTLIAIIQFI